MTTQSHVLGAAPDPALRARGRGWRSGEAGKVARAAVASLAATAVDGGVYQACLAASTSPSAHYASAAALGACFGAVTNFSINRWWTFRAQRTPLFTQALRYTLGSALTLVVLQGLLWLLVERASVTAGLAWLPAKLVTWAVFSYPFQRLLVFAGVRS